MNETAQPSSRLSIATTVTIMLFAVAAAFLAGCADKQPPAARPPTEVAVVTLKSEPVALQAELSGRTTAAVTADVRPQVGGIVKARLFTEGALVKAGQVLYQLDPSVYRAAFDQAVADQANSQAAVAAAKLKDERYTDLLKIEGVSKQDADDASTAHQQAVAAVAIKKAATESARINLEFTQVRAPISGRIGTSTVTAGALVTAAQTTALSTIRALDPIYVDLTQSSVALLKLRNMLARDGVAPGSAAVTLKLEDGSTYAHPGQLKFSEVAVDSATGSVTLRAEFRNPEGALLPGMFVRAVLDQAVEQAGILAPQQGISRDAKGNAMAMVVDSTGKVAQRTVATDRAIGDKWLVSSGLAAGDRLIVQGLNKVKAGDAVKVVELSTTTVAER